MGNKTRKRHNTGEKAGVKQRPAPVIANTVNGVKFPFYPLTDMQALLNDIPNYAQVVAACPAEFQARSNCWHEAAEGIFFHGVEFSRLHFKTSDKPLIGVWMNYFRAWMSSYEPRHETKMAVCGWLLNLMLTECPQFD